MENLVSFDQFVKNVRDAEARGEIHFSKPVSDFDLAVNYAVIRISNKGKHTFTAHEVFYEMMKFAPEMLREEEMK